MAKCLKCGTVYCVYGGSEGSECPKCKSKDIDTSKEKKILKKIVRLSKIRSRNEINVK